MTCIVVHNLKSLIWLLHQLKIEIIKHNYISKNCHKTSTEYAC